MPKTIKNMFDKKLNYIAFYNAHIRASSNKKSRSDVIKYEIDLETNLMNLYNSIKNGKYHVGKYHQFTIYEPKKRIIQSLPYKDRIVHQWYVGEFILPYIVPKFIKDTYACIKNRGTHKAVKQLQNYMKIMQRNNGTYYILKCDIKKYFYSIDKDILYTIMKKHITDKKLLAFTKLLIYDSDVNTGIPIGNYTSQFFANIYLNELDHYVKEHLKVKYYIRYMDDFILLIKTKDDASRMKVLIENYISTKLNLSLNQKSKYYPNKLGVDFCGYHIFETHCLIRKRSKRKIRSIIRKANFDYRQSKLDKKKLEMKYNSWKAHASHANTYNLIRKYNSLFKLEKIK